MIITIEISDAQFKGLEHIAVDPVEWIRNVALGRAAVAMDEIYNYEVDRMLADPAVTSIPSDKDSVVLASVLPSAAALARQALDEAANIPITRIIATAEFRAKFTDTQLAELWSMSASNPALSVFLMKAFTSREVDLDSTDVKDGLAYLMAVGIDVDMAQF